MLALSKIRKAGFTVSLAGNALEVSPASNLTPNQRDFLKQHKAEIIEQLQAETPPLSAADRQKLLDYMAAIDETDPEMIDELLTECVKDAGTLAWALQWADKVLASQIQPEHGLITCRSCQHFQCYNAHGGGAGSCDAGVMPMGACHWSETRHECSKSQELKLNNDLLLESCRLQL
jgi:hypothetical protein